MSITITVSLLLSALGGLEIVPVELDPRSAPVQAPLVAAVEHAQAVPNHKAINGGAAHVGLDLPALTDPPVRGSDQGPNQPSSFEIIALEPGPDAGHSAAEGSTAPKRFQIIDRELRPGWVGQPPQVKGDGDHWIAVSSDPWKSQFEAEEALTRKVRKAIADYIDEQIGRPNAWRGVRLSQADVQRVLSTAQQYREELLFADSSIGVMQQHHAQIVFTPQFRADIRQRWREHLIASRLLRTGSTVVVVFVGLLVAFAVLKSAAR